jgi:hypothetical protein
MLKDSYIFYLLWNVCSMNFSSQRMTQVYAYNVQDYSVLYNNVVCPVECDGWHFTHTSKALAQSH